MDIVPASSVRYAGFWLRVVAAIIDAILLGMVFGFILSSTVQMDPTQMSYATQWLPMVAAWLYSALMESSSYQATLGKMALGLKVTTIDGKRLSFLNATGRHFAKILSGLLLCIGHLMVAFTAKKQGLHDMLAGTLVVKKAI